MPSLWNASTTAAAGTGTSVALSPAPGTMVNLPSAKRSTGPATVVPPPGSFVGSDGGGWGGAGWPATSGGMSGSPPFGVVSGTDTTSPAASMASMRSDDRDVRVPDSSIVVEASAKTPER